MALFQVISGIGSPSASQMRVAFPFSNVVSFLSCIIWGCTVKNTNYITHPAQRMSSQNLLIHSFFSFKSTLFFFLHRINVFTLPTTRAINLSDFKLHFNHFYVWWPGVPAQNGWQAGWLLSCWGSMGWALPDKAPALVVGFMSLLLAHCPLGTS